jgi:hypothetical protein
MMKRNTIKISVLKSRHTGLTGRVSGKLVVIFPDETRAEEIHFIEKKPTLEDLQHHVGGYIERIKVDYEGKVRDGYVDEEGLLKLLPINHRAMEMDTMKLYRGGMPLVGPLVIWVPNKKVRNACHVETGKN